MKPGRENRENSELAIDNFSKAAQNLNTAISYLRRSDHILGQIDATLRVNFVHRKNDGISVNEDDSPEKMLLSVLTQYHEQLKRLKGELASAKSSRACGWGESK